MDTPRIEDAVSSHGKRARSMLGTLLLIALLVGAGYLLARYQDKKEQEEVRETAIDTIVVALRENRNRLEVYRLSGSVVTKRETTGGPGGILRGQMTVKQPWSTSYHVDMRELDLDDYIWDERTRTLMVRAPAVTADAPNIDESRQVVAYRGPIITRDMQTRLRREVAKGARKQAVDEARRAENVAAATQAGREALKRNIQTPLRVAGLGDVTVVVRSPSEEGGDGERWDVSRSIAEVLERRAAQ